MCFIRVDVVSVSEEARLNERWEPPDTSIDALTLPLSIAKRYTKKRGGDGKSMIVDGGEIISASTRDLLLHLLLTSGTLGLSLRVNTLFC